MASSAIINESRSPITHERTETRFKEVLWRSLWNFFNHCLEFYFDIRGFFLKNSFNHSIRGSRSLPKIGHARLSLFQHRTNCLGPPKVPLRANRDIFAWQHATCFGLPKVLLRANREIFAWQLATCFGLPKEFLRANRDICSRQLATCFGPCKEFLRANRDMCARQHMTCLGPLKEFLWASRVILAQQLLL
jgi:hypothetical protein